MENKEEIIKNDCNVEEVAMIEDEVVEEDDNAISIEEDCEDFEEEEEE